MTTRFYCFVGAFVVLGMVVVVSFCFFFKGTDPMSEEAIRKRLGPWISEFIGLSFPGQYSPVFGQNPRLEAYHLTENDRERAVKSLQNTLQNTKKITVEIRVRDLKTDQHGRVEYLLSYDHNLVIKLCEQAGLIGDTVIPTMLTSMSGPDIVFVLYPSEVNLNFFSNETMYITLGKGYQTWKGDMYHLRIACLDTRLQNGETVRSVASRILGPHWLIDEHTPTQIQNWSRSGW